eukprot:gene26205-biopygen14902
MVYLNSQLDRMLSDRPRKWHSGNGFLCSVGSADFITWCFPARNPIAYGEAPSMAFPIPQLKSLQKVKKTNTQSLASDRPQKWPPGAQSEFS